MVVEDVVWRGANAGLRRLRQLNWIRWLGAWLGTFPGWLALPLFLIPEAIGRLGELWAIYLLAHGHLRAATSVYVVVRLLATLMAVFVYQSCEVALLRIGWFATLVSWTRAVRDWSLALIRPARQLLYEIGQRGPNMVMRRIGALRRMVLKQWRRLTAGRS